MWDETPFVDALFKTLHPSVQADEEAARRHLFVVVLGHGEAAHRYLEQGQGFLANSPQLTRGTWPLNIGEDVTLTGQEKIWFRDFELRRR